MSLTLSRRPPACIAHIAGVYVLRSICQAALLPSARDWPAQSREPTARRPSGSALPLACPLAPAAPETLPVPAAVQMLKSDKAGAWQDPTRGACKHPDLLHRAAHHRAHAAVRAPRVQLGLARLAQPPALGYRADAITHLVHRHAAASAGKALATCCCCHWAFHQQPRQSWPS